RSAASCSARWRTRTTTRPASSSWAASAPRPRPRARPKLRYAGSGRSTARSWKASYPTPECRQPEEKPVDIELQLRLERFNADYAATIDDDRLEEWPEFFTDDCLYVVTHRESYEAGYPH